MSKLLATRATANPTIGQATGFELASPDRWTAGNIDSALERNRVFAAAGGHRAAVVFPTLRPSARPEVPDRAQPARGRTRSTRSARCRRNMSTGCSSSSAFIAALWSSVPFDRIPTDRP